MAEQAVEVSPPPPRRGGNPLTRKYGPLPGWGWAAAAGGAFLLYRWWQNRSSSSSSSGTSTSGTSTTGIDYGPQISTLQAEIQQLQQGTQAGQQPSRQPVGVPPVVAGGKGGERYVRHVSTGKQSLAQIARGRNEKPAAIYRVSERAPESARNLAKLAKWEKRPKSRRKGVVYYTEH